MWCWWLDFGLVTRWRLSSFESKVARHEQEKVQRSHQVGIGDSFFSSVHVQVHKFNADILFEIRNREARKSRVANERY